MKQFLPAILGALLLSACSVDAAEDDGPKAATILPETLGLPLLRDSAIIADCKHEAILAGFAELTCVDIIFPAELSSSEGKESFASALSSLYAARITEEGWALTTDWDMLKAFEKPVSEDCSTKVKIMTWMVDEAKPVADRNFETSRFAFIRDEAAVCGDKRKAPR